MREMRPLQRLFERAGEFAEKNRKVREERTGENSPRAEYNRLRKQLYDLHQAAKNVEVKVNCAADEVKHWERNIEDLLSRKKIAVAENRLGDERFCERQIEKAENELLDARERLTREQRSNHSAVRELKAWKTANGARLEELSKSLG